MYLPHCSYPDRNKQQIKPNEQQSKDKGIATHLDIDRYTPCPLLAKTTPHHNTWAESTIGSG